MNADLNTILLWTLLFVGYWWFVRVNARLSLAELRHKLFTARGELFDQGYELGINFESDAYGIARATLNGLLRFAHKLNFPQTFLMVFVSKKYFESEMTKDYKRSLNKAVKKLAPEQEELVKKVLSDANKAVLLYIVKTSLLLNILLIPVIIVAFLLQKTSQLKGRIIKSSFAKKINSILDAEANAIGHKI